MMASTKISVTVDTRWTLAWVRFVRFMSPMLVRFMGPARVWRLGTWGTRFLRWRIGSGRWRRLDLAPPPYPEADE